MFISKNLIKRLKEENYEIKEECKATVSYNIDLESMSDTSLEVLDEGCYETKEQEVLPQLSDITYSIYKNGELCKAFESITIDDIKDFLKKFNEQSLKEEYKKFKLQWLIDHGYTLNDFVDHLEENYKHQKENPKSLFEEFEKCGFNSNIYPSFDEWYRNDANITYQKEIKIPLTDDLSLIAINNIEPFDKEINIYLENNGDYQDIATICPNYTIYQSTGTVHYDNDSISVKVFENKPNQNSTIDFDIAIEKGLRK